MPASAARQRVGDRFRASAQDADRVGAGPQRIRDPRGRARVGRIAQLFLDLREQAGDGQDDERRVEERVRDPLAQVVRDEHRQAGRVEVDTQLAHVDLGVADGQRHRQARTKIPGEISVVTGRAAVGHDFVGVRVDAAAIGVPCEELLERGEGELGVIDLDGFGRGECAVVVGADVDPEAQARVEHALRADLVRVSRIPVECALEVRSVGERGDEALLAAGGVDHRGADRGVVCGEPPLRCR